MDRVQAGGPPDQTATYPDVPMSVVTQPTTVDPSDEQAFACPNTKPTFVGNAEITPLIQATGASAVPSKLVPNISSDETQQ